MTLPTFVGIGVPRAGTTWLHTLLSAHPEVYLPTTRKEIRYFDRHLGRGLAWYESFFCSADEAKRYRAIGEISPQYLYCEDCPRRIAEALPAVKLLVMLRHPVDRAYSQYGFVVQRRNYRASFEEFLATRPRALEMGHYSRHLSGYLQRFGADRILVLVFEDAIADGETVRGRLGPFLDVPAEGFPSSVGRINRSTVPTFGSMASVAVRAGRALRRRHLEPVVDLAARLGGRRILATGTALPRLDPASRTELSRRFEGEFEALERLVKVDLSAWRT